MGERVNKFKNGYFSATYNPVSPFLDETQEHSHQVMSSTKLIEIKQLSHISIPHSHSHTT